MAEIHYIVSLKQFKRNKDYVFLAKDIRFSRLTQLGYPLLAKVLGMNKKRARFLKC